MNAYANPFLPLLHSLIVFASWQLVAHLHLGADVLVGFLGTGVHTEVELAKER